MKRRRRIGLLVTVSLLAVVTVAGLLSLTWIKPRGPLAQLELADGRILQVEAVTYGTVHRIGQRSVIADRLGPWLPSAVRDLFYPKTPENTIDLAQPGLVVWVNAIDPVTKTNVDCQGIRVEFVDQHGTLFGEDTHYWFGGQTFWRVGHVFHCYPRDERQLTLRVTPWKRDKNIPVTMTLLNPHVSEPEIWSGRPLPQTQSVGQIRMALVEISLRTNEQTYWQTPSTFFEPTFELRRDGHPAAGWSKPEWFAEDPTGNRGQHLSPNWPVLRFSATVYPTPTNAEAAVLIATLPETDLSTLTNRTWWNLKFESGSNEVVALGICPPGTQVFSEGQFDTNGPSMGPVLGGAPSGWTGQGRRVNPMRVQEWDGHYTPYPAIYVRANDVDDADRLAVRLRDPQDRYWIAEPEPQGVREGIHPFLIEVPPGVTNVTPEVVRLKPVHAEFMVETGAGPGED